MHDPERAEEAAEARRVGGQRRRKEGTIAVVYDLETLDTVEGIRRVVDIVVTEALAREGGNQRDRVLLSAAQVAIKLLEVGDHEARIAALEVAHEERHLRDEWRAQDQRVPRWRPPFA